MRKSDQSGFITMVIMLLAIIIAAIVFVFLRIKNAQG